MTDEELTNCIQESIESAIDGESASEEQFEAFFSDC